LSDGSVGKSVNSGNDIIISNSFKFYYKSNFTSVLSSMPA
jgi:hypothetical protein